MCCDVLRCVVPPVPPQRKLSEHHDLVNPTTMNNRGRPASGGQGRGICRTPNGCGRGPSTPRGSAPEGDEAPHPVVQLRLVEGEEAHNLLVVPRRLVEGEEAHLFVVPLRRRQELFQ